MIGFVVLAPRAPDGRQLGGQRPAQDRRTPGRSFLSQMQATEALLDVRKFDAFNRMSAFVVHDLKNIVTQLSLMLKNAQAPAGQPGVPAGHADDRGELARPDAPADAATARRRHAAGHGVGVDLQPIVGASPRSRAERGRALELDIADAVATRGRNASSASSGTWCRTRSMPPTPMAGPCLVDAGRAGQALIEVGDTGHGMSPEFVRNRLFKPFPDRRPPAWASAPSKAFSTCKNWAARSRSTAQVGVGTVITILLPLFEVQRHSDLQPLGVS